MKNLLKIFAHSLTIKYIDEAKLQVKHIFVKKDDISYFNLSSNIICYFSHNEKIYYFRECPRVNNFNDFINYYIAEFFTSVDHIGINKEHFKQKVPLNLNFSTEQILEFKEYITKKCNNKKYMLLLKKIDVISKKIGFSVWNEICYDMSFFRKFGMEDIQEDLKDIAVYFLWYIKSVVGIYRTNRYIRGKTYSFFAATKTIASRIVAEELGLEHMIVDAKWCQLEIENQESKFGVLCDSAPGARMLDSVVVLDGTLQRELLNLNVLDMICYQVDHGPNNYNVFYGNDKKYHICAFDNDNPVTFFPRYTLKHYKVGAVPFIDKNGYILRPFFDKQLAVRMANLDFQDFRKKLKPYLNELQIVSIISRIRRLNKAIELTCEIKKNFLINENEWCEETIEAELSGKYGVTYLTNISDGIIKVESE